MEAAIQAELVEELMMHGVPRGKYLALAQKVVARLNWIPVSVDEGSLICYTSGDDYYNGEAITIRVGEKAARYISRPLHEYYGGDPRANAKLFSAEMGKAVAAYEKAERNLHPVHREKYGALIPSKSYLVTPLIFYVNVLVFIAMVVAGLSPLHPTARELYDWGGNLRPAVESGEWWRLVTYIFLHGGAMHLLMNSFALLYIGMFLEPLMGRFRFFSAYMLTGVCAGLMSLSIHTQSVGVGASGAIFGMYGVFLSMLTTSHIQKTLRKTMLRSILFFVVLNLLYGMQGNTDNAAHIGGLLSGILAGYAFYPGIKAKSTMGKQAAVATALTLGTVLLTYFLLWY